MSAATGADLDADVAQLGASMKDGAGERRDLATPVPLAIGTAPR